MKTKENTFEEKLTKLEEIIEILDRGDIPLDELLKNYEEGTNLITKLRDYLNKAELKITEIDNKANQ